MWRQLAFDVIKGSTKFLRLKNPVLLTWPWKFCFPSVSGILLKSISNRIRMLDLVRASQVWIILFYKLTMVYIIQLTAGSVFLYNLRQIILWQKGFFLLFQLPSFNLPGITNLSSLFQSWRKLHDYNDSNMFPWKEKLRCKLYSFLNAGVKFHWTNWNL